MMWDGGWGMGAAGALWILVMIAVLALIVVGIVFLVRGLTGQPGRHDLGHPGARRPEPGGTPPGATALQILEERYARGEIDREEFVQRRQDLLGR